MSSAALQWHMSCAWTKPLADDETAVAWLLSESTVVQVQAINAIPITEIAALAKSYTAQEQFQRASELYYALIEHGTDVSNADRIEFCKLQLSVVQQVPADERNTKDTLATTKSAATMFSASKMVRSTVDILSFLLLNVFVYYRYSGHI